uniref:VOC family protein n=1 Tax=candidate division WOR-3 bacterium TaxID=2052148 RepID=A0A7C3NE89_UNCW3
MKKGGIIFFKTKKLDQIKNFYIENFDMEIFLDQKKCVILKYENLLLGFCDSEEVENSSTITFFYESKNKVEKMYEKLKKLVTVDLKINPYFKIYHFYIKDPEGRNVEIQHFLDKISEVC